MVKQLFLCFQRFKTKTRACFLFKTAALNLFVELIKYARDL